MQSTIRPLVKNKGGDLTDPNNYRAIALANMETKILESILMEKLRSYDDCDKYQYGFKKGHSTAMCTSAVKKSLTIIEIVAAMFFCVLSISAKHLIVLIIGSYSVSYWMMA